LFVRPSSRASSYTRIFFGNSADQSFRYEGAPAPERSATHPSSHIAGRAHSSHPVPAAMAHLCFTGSRPLTRRLGAEALDESQALGLADTAAERPCPTVTANGPLGALGRS
jgi:hypothetical protein